jgi:hypothetical protein
VSHKTGIQRAFFCLSAERYIANVSEFYIQLRARIAWTLDIGVQPLQELFCGYLLQNRKKAWRYLPHAL